MQTEVTQKWVGDIEDALKRCGDADSAARLIMQRLETNHRLRFGPACLPWIQKLVLKWRSKTPDTKQQADSISGAIDKRRLPVPEYKAR